MSGNEILNTCYETTRDYHPLVYYSHIVVAVMVCYFAFSIFWSGANRQASKIFLYFAVLFMFWLVGDTFVWTLSNYHLVNFFWSLLDFTNVLFFVAGTLLVINTVQIGRASCRERV